MQLVPLGLDINPKLVNKFTNFMGITCNSRRRGWW